MRYKIIIGNWKMNKTPAEAVIFVKQFHKLAKDAFTNHQTVVGFAVPSTCLDALSGKISKNIVIASQDCFYEDKGAYTGEISASMLKEMGIFNSLVGHSERRKYFNETNKTCNLKLKKLISLNMYPIYCVGETAEEYEQGIGKDIVKQQVLEGLEGIENISDIVIAYEPVWSIGTGKNASKDIAQDMCKYIRDILREVYGEQADNVLIQYGGSVKANNVKEYIQSEDIDGVLVGGASLDVDSFKKLINNSL